MNRHIYAKLLKWKISRNRKVLLIRGARQVGKTYSIRHFARQFEHLAELNFDENPEANRFFDESLTPADLCPKIAAFLDVPIEPGRTLLFFDEIQACPNCLKALRFFQEKLPELHVIAAGSLLEFALENIPSFGVGRISFLYMYPMGFAEFVEAVAGRNLSSVINETELSSPVSAPLHSRLLDLLQRYMVVGGMPAVVNAYAKTADLRESQVLLDEILSGFYTDFAKYRKTSDVYVLDLVFRSVAMQAGGKFKFSRVSPEETVRRVKIALELLVKAGLCHKVFHTSATGIPLGAQVNPKKFKVIPLDIGLHQRMLGLDLSQFLVENAYSMVNKGDMAEILTGLELLVGSNPHMAPQLHYWHRESRGSSAEVDYVIQQDRRIIPLEVKAGKQGSMKSMRMFLKERGFNKGIRISQENFGDLDSIHIVPLYAVSRLASSASWVDGAKQIDA